VRFIRIKRIGKFSFPRQVKHPELEIKILKGILLLVTRFFFLLIQKVKITGIGLMAFREATGYSTELH